MQRFMSSGYSLRDGIRNTWTFVKKETDGVGETVTTGRSISLVVFMEVGEGGGEKEEGGASSPRRIIVMRFPATEDGYRGGAVELFKRKAIGLRGYGLEYLIRFRIEGR